MYKPVTFNISVSNIFGQAQVEESFDLCFNGKCTGYRVNTTKCKLSFFNGIEMIKRTITEKIIM